MTALYRPRPACEPTPRELAEWVDGCLVNAAKAPERLTGFGTLETALPTEVTFIGDSKRVKTAAQCEAGLFITPYGLEVPGRARLEVKHVWSAVATILSRLYGEAPAAVGVHPSAVLGDDVQLGADVLIEAGCVVGNGVKIGARARLGPNCTVDPACVIGEGCRLHAGVALQGHVQLGRNVVLHSGVVIGADGFRYEPGPQGILKIPQVGAVILEDEVEVGANSTIDRAFIHETRIGYGTKIDNQVQIGHNCRIGKFCLICGCVGIAGSVTIGDGCILGGGVGVRDGLTIGSGAQIAGGSQLGEDVPAGGTVMGYAAFPARDFIKANAYFRRLPELARRLAALERLSKNAPDKPDA
jgi:UDP-3-O-[3-hydroxymyristoyl] glucosamine N-acyltransferase